MNTTVTGRRRASTTGGARADGLRPDIQGLRAIAVTAVLVFHVAPGALPGGYVGVDVFFVISGFLITLHLLSRPPAGLRDLAGFWSRRIRRLLPASLLVLATTLCASRLVAPETQWENTARQTRAAAAYFVNWLLAHDAVDYLAADNLPTPVQHFWSLSVEEQFYFVWPVLILAAAWLARRRGWHPNPTIGGALLLVVAASFWFSVSETANNPAAAYFVTPTRMWELGVGGLVAVWATRGRLVPAPVAAPLAWAGLAAIAFTCWQYSSATPFPGYQAALPVCATAAVIAARSDGAGSPTQILRLRPVQWLGDVSYAVYLWHWPLVVLVPYVSGGSIGALDGATIIVTTLILAALTKTYVEDPFRRASWGVPLRKPYVLAAVGMAVVMGLASLQLVETRHRSEEAADRVRTALADGGPCFGAAALDAGRSCPRTPAADVVPTPAQAATDKSDLYDVKDGKDCRAKAPKYEHVTCTFGDRRSRTTIVLAGNSHAGQWLPTLQVLAKAHGWRIRTHVASQCSLLKTDQAFPSPGNARRCNAWVRRTTNAVLRERPALVVISNRLDLPAAGHEMASSGPAYAEGFRQVVDTWRKGGLKVLSIRDTPAPPFRIPDCLSQHGLYSPRCNGSLEDWKAMDPSGSVIAAMADPNVRQLDLTSHICADGTCTGVTGGIITWFDASHLTATYARTLAPYLEQPLTELIRR